jgi:phospholipid-translocating ATPase
MHNKLILSLQIFVFLATMCLVCAVGSGIWESLVGYSFAVYLPWESHVPTDKNGGSAVVAVLQFFSYIIVLNTVVPISLYVR